MRITFETAGNLPLIERKFFWFCAEKCLPVAEQAPLLQPLMMKSFCASLACCVPICPVRDSWHYFCSLCATELHAGTTALWEE